MAKIRTDDKHRGFIFVFGSPGAARKWRRNTPLWRHYVRAQGELYIEMCLTERESYHVAEMIEERETEEFERMRREKLAERERRREHAPGYHVHRGGGIGKPVEAKNSGFARWMGR